MRARHVAVTILLIVTGGPDQMADAGEQLSVFEGLGDLPGGPFTSFAHAVSADGAVVVGRGVSSDEPASHEAFRWTAAEGIVGLGDLGTDFLDSDARGVSDDGSVAVGEATPDSVTHDVPFRWTVTGGMEALHDSDDSLVAGQAFDVSNDGNVVVGVGRMSGPNEAFRWTPSGGAVGLGWLPGLIQDSFAFGTSTGGSVVCGISFSGPGADVETFRWTEDNGLVGMGDVPGGVFYAIAWDVSDDGSTIVGEARTLFGNDEMFIWRSETGFVFPDSLHGATFGSSAQAASADGSIVVGAGEGGAVIWDTTHGMRSVASILTSELGVDLTGWQLTGATGVSADGHTIVGDGLHPNGDREAWIARLPAGVVAAPEPAGNTGFALSAAWPNPFSSGTSVALTIPFGGCRVRATVHDVVGRVLRTLVDRRLPGGSHRIRWDGLDRMGRPAAGGIYFIRAETEEGVLARKVIRRP